MSVITIKEIFRGRDGSWDTSKQGTIRKYRRVWRAKTDSRYDDGEIVNAAMYAAFPIGSVFPNDQYAWLRGLSPSQGEGPYVWYVTGQYSTEYQPDADPTQEPAKISWATQIREKVFTQDRNGWAILNSAGFPFVDPMVKGDDSRWTCSVKKNVSAVPAWILTYRDAINASSFTIQGLTIPAKCGKIMSIGISEWQRAPANSIYYILTWSFCVHPVSWDEPVLDAGLMQNFLCPDGTHWYVPCWDAAGQRVTRPVPMNGAGGQILNPTPQNAQYITVEKYNLKDFSALPTS